MGAGVGPSTDLYATGAIAYELFSGAVPFGNREPIAILLAQVQEPPVPLAERAPDVPAPIAAWVDRLLAKAPEDRPPSAQAAWDELEEHLLDCAGPAGDAGAARGRAREMRPDSRPITPARFPSEGLKTPAPPASATPLRRPRRRRPARRHRPRRPRRRHPTRRHRPGRRPVQPDRPRQRPPPTDPTTPSALSGRSPAAGGAAAARRRRPRRRARRRRARDHAARRGPEPARADREHR